MKNTLLIFIRKALECMALLFAIISTSSNLFSQSLMFGGNANHSGSIYNSEFPSDVVLTKKWALKTNGKIFGTAAVKDNMIYFGSDDSCLYAIAANGNLKWKFKTQGKIRSSPAIKDTVLYFNNYEGMFYALDTRTGDEIWSFLTDGEDVNKAKGLFGWEPKDKILDDPWDFYQSSPVYKDTIIYFGCGKNMYALNIRNGSLVWKFETPKVIHSTPAVSDGKVYFGCWDSKVYAVNALTGEKVWDYQTGLDANLNMMTGIQSSPSVIDSLVVVGSRDASIYALHNKTGKLIWKNSSFNNSWMPSSFTVINDTLYTGSSDAASFYAFNKSDGKTKYSIKLANYTFSSPAFSNGLIFIGNFNGGLYCINSKSRKIVSRFDTDGHKKNAFKILKEDGSIDFSKLPNSVLYEDNILWLEMVYSLGCIASSPVIENNVVYFGATDSIFYAVQDNGLCKPKFSTLINQIELLNISEESLDTTIHISFTSECYDTIIIKKNFSGILNNAIAINPQSLEPNQSLSNNIKVSIDFSLLKSSTYKGSLILFSKTNPYNSKEIGFTIKKAPLSLNFEKDAQDNFVYPNPFAEQVTIKYNLKRNTNVKIQVFNLSGKHIRTLYAGYQTTGNHEFSWNGKDEYGNSLTAGNYIIRVDNAMSSYTANVIKSR